MLCFYWVSKICSAQTTPVELIENGHWKQVRTVVEARIQQAPNDALAHFLLSQIRNAFGDRATPLSLAEKAVALDGNTGKYHRQVAEVLGVMAQHSNALQQLFLARRFRKEIDMALALDPRDLQALRDLMEYYLLAPGIAGGDRRQAEATAERIVAIDKVEGLSARALIAAFEKRMKESEVLLREAAAVSPSSYKALIALAQSYLAPDHGNADAAETTAKEALRVDPGRVDAYLILAAVYAGQARWKELDAVLQESSREVPDDLAPYYRAAERIIGSRHDVDRAERYLRTYLTQEPEGNEPSLAEARQQLTHIAKDRHASKGL